MPDDLSGHLVDLPADRLDLGPLKGLVQDQAPEQEKEVGGQDPDPEVE